MSRSYWQAALLSRLRTRTAANESLRVAIVGVGSDLHGDDAAGVTVARRLQSSERLLAVDGGAAPENATGALRDFCPNLVVFVDAVHMEAPPGTTVLIDEAQISGVSASTHSLPLDVLAAFLRSELRCDVALIGIQPAAMTFDTPMSPPVVRAVERLVRFFGRALAPSD